MRRSIASYLVLTLTWTAQAHALQVVLEQSVGVDLTKLAGPGTREGAAGIGGSAGVALALPLLRGVGVNLGMRYSLRHTTVPPQAIEFTRTFSSWLESVDRSLSAGFLEVPVSVGPVLPLGSTTLHLEGGAIAALRLHCNLQSDVTIGYVASDPRTYRTVRSCREDLRPADIGLNLAARVTLPLGAGRIALALRYTASFSTVYQGACQGLTVGGQPGCLQDLGFDGKYRVLTLALVVPRVL